MDSTLEEQVARREEVLASIRRMLADTFNLGRTPDEIDPDTPLFGTGLGLDSVDAVELVICLDTVFGVRLRDDPIGRTDLRTVNTLVDLALAHREPAHVGG